MLSGERQTVISTAACDPETLCALLEEQRVVLDSY